MKVDISPLTAIEIAENIFEIKARLPGRGKTIREIILLTEE